jgi:Tol biopolymer transport system component
MLPVFALIVLAAAAQAQDPPSAQHHPEEALLSDVRQLTFGKQFAAAGEAYFSPDGKWVIFQATPHGEEHYQMYIAPVRSYGVLGEAVRISKRPSRNTCGHFSPDGKTVIFGSTAGKEKADEPKAGYQREGRDYRWSFPDGMEIWLWPAWQHALANGGQRAAHGEMGDIEPAMARRALTDNQGYDAEGSFSPDGRHIVFSSNRSGDMEIYIGRLNADQSGFDKVVQITDAPGYDGGPFFSPDGKKLVYRSDRQENHLLQVFVRELEFDADGNITGGGSEAQVTNDRHVNWGPYWHPSGNWLIFATSRHGHENYEVYLIRADGSEASRVTHTPRFDGLPVFSADGELMMWTSQRGGDGSQLFVARFNLPE